jgi:hypothetical protein
MKDYNVETKPPKKQDTPKTSNPKKPQIKRTHNK